MVAKKSPTKKVAPKTTPVREVPVPVTEGVIINVQKEQKTYKGLCILLTVALYIILLIAIYTYIKYDVSLDARQTHVGTVKQSEAVREAGRGRYRVRLPRERAACIEACRKYQERNQQEGTLMSPETRRQTMPVRRRAVPPTPAPARVSPPAAAPVGCPPPVARRVPYSAAEYVPYAKGGSAKIAGKACFTLEDKSEKCFPNLVVFINPVTNYSNEWYVRGWAGTERLADADPRVVPFNVSVKTAADGSYAFENIAPGTYYVGTQVCLPKTKTDKACTYKRFAAKVTMKKLVSPTLLQVYPKP